MTTRRASCAPAAERRQSIDIDAHMETEARLCRAPSVRTPPRTLLVSESGLAGPWPVSRGHASEVVVNMRNPFDGHSRALRACAGGKGLVSARPSLDDFGTAMLVRPEDHVGLRFPRNLPWNSLPILASPRYTVGSEEVVRIAAWEDAEGLHIAQARRSESLEEVSPTLERAIARVHSVEAEYARWDLLDLRVALDIMGVPEIPVVLVDKTREIEYPSSAVRALVDAMMRYERPRYVYALNGCILFERVCNAVWAAHPESPASDGGRLAPVGTPRAAALLLSSHLDVLQTLYAVARVADARGWGIVRDKGDLASVLAHLITDGDQRRWDYGVVRHRPLGPNEWDDFEWIGTGSYPPYYRGGCVRYARVFGATRYCTTMDILIAAGLVRRMRVVALTDECSEPCAENEIAIPGGKIPTPHVPTERGRALLALLPRECEDPDMMQRFVHGEDAAEAIRRMDRRLMKFFRALKRAVADLPASWEPRVA